MPQCSYDIVIRMHLLGLNSLCAYSYLSFAPAFHSLFTRIEPEVTTFYITAIIDFAVSLFIFGIIMITSLAIIRLA